MLQKFKAPNAGGEAGKATSSFDEFFFGGSSWLIYLFSFNSSSRPQGKPGRANEFQLKGYLPSESSAPWLPFSDLQVASDTTSADGVYGQRRGAFIMRPPVPWKMMFRT